MNRILRLLLLALFLVSIAPIVYYSIGYFYPRFEMKGRKL